MNLRNDLAISENVPLIGLVARFHPRKDHHNFARAAARFAQWDRTARFVLCGAGVDRNNQQLMGWLREGGVLHRTHLLGHRTDIARLMPGLDLLTSASFSEGFPKVIAQAMACGVPVVATDTGDSREIVANTGCIVPIRNPDALAQGWKRLLDLPQAQRQDLANAARRRACEQYALVDVARRYETLYQDVVARRRP